MPIQVTSFVAQLIRQATPMTSSTSDWHSVNVDSLQLEFVRARWGLSMLLLGNGAGGVAGATGAVGAEQPTTGNIGRLAAPGSERATHRWLRDTSALGDMMQLYRASDALMAHREAIEDHLFGAAMTLFELQPTVTLTSENTYFECRVPGGTIIPRKNAAIVRYSHWVSCWMPVASYGARRCSLATSASRTRWPRCSPHIRALVVMDRGIATQDNITWLAEQGYRYLVVSRRQAHL